MRLSIATLFTALMFVGCSNPQPGPDKTAAGIVLGAGWGAGAGAVVGNQVGNPGQGVAVGAGIGALSGAMTGAGYDIVEESQVRQEEELASLKIQNLANRRELAQIQDTLGRDESVAAGHSFYQVFFDDDATNLKAGSVANLEAFTEAVKSDPHARMIRVTGHTDDTGNPEYNQRLAEARAREVSAYLMSRGISSDQIQVSSYGAQRPIASNSTPVGRQLNRRVDVFVMN